ncbi:thiamine phosphate synthase [Paralcaligenes ginsengisoli]
MTTLLRFPRGVYGITPEWADTQRLLAAIEAAADGGMAALQWRRKTGTLRERQRQARALAKLCKKRGILFIVNDDWRLAAELDADGVHLGREDGQLAEARLGLGSGKIVGCSCYNDPALAQQALAADVDYIAFGALYPSSIKPEAVRATLEHIRIGRALAEGKTRAGARVAVVAIGGLTADNAAPVIQAGADSIALISGLFGSSRIRATAARCDELFR